MITQAQLQFIIDNYQKMFYKDIAKKLGLTSRQVLITVKIAGLRKGSGNHASSSPFCVKHDYFSHWSTTMSYILGFLFADGYVDTNNGHHTLAIELAERDKNILELIQNEICPDCPIRSRQRRLESKTYTLVQLKFSSKQLISDLKKLALNNIKKFRYKLPLIPKEFEADFLRGLFDGDGSFCIDTRRKGSNKVYHFPIFSLCGPNQDFLLQVKEKLGNNIGSIHKSSGSNCYLWQTKRLTNVISIGTKMYYNNSVPHLSRKYNKFLEIKGWNK